MSSPKVTYASPEEERRWNSLSEKMTAFHNWFKEEYKMIYESADGSYTKRGLSLPRYLDTIVVFNYHLHAHHTTEERLVFPVLAKGIPKFARNARDGHVDSHKSIHDALQNLLKRVDKWRNEPTTYSPTEMRGALDKLADVLFKHLDEEVEDIQGDKLKPHFKLEEIERIGR
ncbi:putative hemerythrin HHE cation binding domain [Lyophyllum shimeji]|uniref:Hemerythrin HHE cation binding domain n=1 Tax=Lyophyllum shimeji TaxID=47721 RepID=A0A9P3PL52_LYOSH|nr:putative hemerythrin HHE cation binding domain [Lyophyllum shimeji]